MAHASNILFSTTEKLNFSARELRGYIRALEHISNAAILNPAHIGRIKDIVAQAWMQTELVAIYASNVDCDKKYLVRKHRRKQIQQV